MLADVFDPGAPPDSLLRTGEERGGAASIMIGIAANRCFETGQPVRIDSLVTGLGRPPTRAFLDTISLRRQTAVCSRYATYCGDCVFRPKSCWRG
ncbi:hypothetical protein ABAC402_09140 [Asticcacaulis sp. AC402]|nr:hypothetical protein ABAC402_09140 [Asticcacaulis sp. AC402]